jgi:hypothetical protein
MKLLAVAFAILAAGCGGGDDDSTGFDGELDCPSTWATSFSYPPDAEGSMTPFQAMQEWSLEFGEVEFSIHVETARTGTVVVAGAEVAVLEIVELPTETFAVLRVSGCEGFEA